MAIGKMDSVVVPTNPSERRAGFAVIGIYAVVLLLALAAVLLVRS